jgi:hypothetical protein
MIALVLLNGKGLPPLGQTNDDISHWVANVVTSRRQIERELPSRAHSAMIRHLVVEKITRTG